MATILFDIYEGEQLRYKGVDSALAEVLLQTEGVEAFWEEYNRCDAANGYSAVQHGDPWDVGEAEGNEAP